MQYICFGDTRQPANKVCCELFNCCSRDSTLSPSTKAKGKHGFVEEYELVRYAHMRVCI